jgi:DNA-binding MarR family transcriptional regulator
VRRSVDDDLDQYRGAVGELAADDPPSEVATSNGSAAPSRSSGSSRSGRSGRSGRSDRPSRPGHDGADPAISELVDAVLTASRVLVAVAARSLGGVDAAVTLPQFRALVVLSSAGPRSVGELADALAVHSSTATRVCDRLVRHGLVERTERPDDRRETVVALTDTGRRLVDDVTAARRIEIERILARMPLEARPQVVAALQAFADAAGEPPATGWTLGWE